MYHTVFFYEMQCLPVQTVGTVTQITYIWCLACQSGGTPGTRVNNMEHPLRHLFQTWMNVVVTILFIHMTDEPLFLQPPDEFSSRIHPWWLRDGLILSMTAALAWRTLCARQSTFSRLESGSTAREVLGPTRGDSTVCHSCSWSPEKGRKKWGTAVKIKGVTKSAACLPWLMLRS